MINLIFYIILGYFISELFHITIWEWAKVKFRLNEKKVKSILVFLGIALFISTIGSGFYRVKTYENVIVTSIFGSKIIKENPGIKYNFLSSRESINLQKQILKFPVDYSDNGYQIITQDGKPISVNSFLEYQINDARKWGIENKDSNNKLLIDFSYYIKNKLQNSKYDYIINNIPILSSNIKEEMLSAEDKYGIEIIDVKLQISDTTEVKLSKSSAESQKINSASLKESYLSESEALKIKYNSINDKEFIKYMEFIKAIKEGKIQTIIVPENSIISSNIIDAKTL